MSTTQKKITVAPFIVTPQQGAEIIGTPFVFEKVSLDKKSFILKNKTTGEKYTFDCNNGYATCPHGFRKEVILQFYSTPRKNSPLVLGVSQKIDG